ncbi:MAG: hypothetical protein IME99_07330, partial [Proteobacteria bacterium]|nr:hypothetical protein [Pseudomonadota bacterium]
MTSVIQMTKNPFILLSAALCLLFLSTPFLSSTADGAGEFSGYVAAEADLFAHGPSHPGQKEHAASISIRPEYYREWNGGDRSLTFAPYLRVDSADTERTHFDIRELFWYSVREKYELGIGLRQVFWGVTESQHLVDIVNQTDAVDSLDGEEKLGAPMVSLSVPLDSTSIGDLGTIDIYLLPWFRERTFVGKKGRLRGATPVDTDQTEYESGAKEHNIDIALRWSRSIGDYEIGLSYFTGTARTPSFRTGTDAEGDTVYIPRYVQIDQAGLEAQKVHGDWSLKLEAIARSGQGDVYGAWTGGFEYTMVA